MAARTEPCDESLPADFDAATDGGKSQPQPTTIGHVQQGEATAVEERVNGTDTVAPAQGSSTEVPPDDIPFFEDIEEIGYFAKKSVERNIFWIAQVAFLIVIWWSSAIAITLLVKWTVGNYASERRMPYPYPFAITSSVNLITMFLACCLSTVVDKKKVDDEPRPSWERMEIVKVLSIGVIQGAELGCNNKAVEFMPVSEKVMFHSMFVLFVMAFARLWGLEMLGWRRLAAGFFILLGGFFQGLGGQEHESSHSQVKGRANADHRQIGWIITVTAMLLGAQRWVLIQMVLHRSPHNTALGKMTKLEFTSRTLPVAGVVCFILACIFEEEAFDLRHMDSTALPISVPSISVGIICLTMSELGLVHLTSAVALQVLATLHQIPIVMVSSIVFKERIPALSQWGFRLCLIGALIYTWAYRMEAKASSKKHSHTAIESDAGQSAES
mmetsp:Transcript_13879/g.25540  ORF Transcript_13879/g.25540 Transcript_13879/m.25540 type:complete len:442 (+) Transcript_13879:27-1352(+)